MQTLLLSLAFAAVPCLVASEDPSPQHVQWMKETGALNGKIRKGEDVEASAKRLAALYKDVAVFWSPRSETGKKTTADIQSGADALAKAAAAGDAAGVAAASRTIGGSCRTCHDTHREKISETEYKIK
ncbi:MAG: cytochrome c [Acidobacteria bacterium]|nr:cytochrome c [Acidobacteriota bacterium]